MPTRNATAVWEGKIRDGKGTFTGESGAISAPYTFNTRFGDAKGTNPEELLAAAEAACFTMALSGNLERNGTPPTHIETRAACTVVPEGGGFKITTIQLMVTAQAAGIDQAALQRVAEETKKTCPVSMALTGVNITVEAKLG